MKIFFQGARVLFEVNLGLTSRLAAYKDLEVIVGTSEPLLYLYGSLFSRHYKNLKIVITQPTLPSLTPSIEKIGNLMATMIIRSSLHKKFLSNSDILHLNDLEHPYTRASIDFKKPKLLTLNWLPGRLEEDVIAKMDMVVACSKSLSKIVNNKIGYKPKVIRHGVDTTLFNTLIPKIEARRYLGFPLSRKIIFWNGRLVPSKNLRTLIDAIPIVAKEIPDTLFVIKGRTKRLRYNYILRYAKRHLKTTGTEQSVKFKIGYEWLSKMPYYYRSADVFVHTSSFESFGLVFAEAMACGIPIVATSISAAREIVGDAGLLFETKNSDDLADKLLRLLSDDKLRMLLSERGLNRIFKLGLVWEKAAKSYRDLYLSLI